MPDQPWVMRTYAGHSSAQASNELYRLNLSKGQTGLSIAFDLPTQTGYDPDSPMAKGEVGKVGVPVSHIGDMRVLLDQIPLNQMNTSMTINAPAMWLLAMYVAVAEEQGVATNALMGTTQNDIIKEYLSRGTYIFPPAPSMRLISDMISWSVEAAPKWNPINICSYHLQEAGATPVQELAFALSSAIAVLDEVKKSGQVSAERFGEVVGRISFFVNSGMRFVEELAKMRAFASLWDDITANRYGITDAKQRRFRYGVQVNSLGLTEAQPENNVARIMLELLGVTLSKNARARAVQLPAWNEALGLPRSWDQQWSLRMQQVLAYETDLLEYEDIFEGSHVVEAKVAQLEQAAREEMNRIDELGGMVAAVESGYLKTQLVSSHANRRARIESGDEIVVGVNRYQETEASPLMSETGDAILHVDPRAQEQAIDAVRNWRAHRDNEAVARTLAVLIQVAKSDANLMEASIACARAGVTTGEWSDALRGVFGEFRAPTGVAGAHSNTTRSSLVRARQAVETTAGELGHPLRLLVAKPGLDGHSNGAEQVALGARDAGFEVVYQGIRLSSGQIINAALQEDVDCIGISILSGSHLDVVPEIVTGVRENANHKIPVVVGGIIPEPDAEQLFKAGVSDIFTPKDFDMGVVMQRVVEVIRKENGLAPLAAVSIGGNK